MAVVWAYVLDAIALALIMAMIIVAIVLSRTDKPGAPKDGRGPT